MNQRRTPSAPGKWKRAGCGLMAFALSLSFFPTPLSMAAETTPEETFSLVAEYDSALSEEAIISQTLDDVVTLDDDGSQDSDQAAATHWSQPFLDKMVQYGYMRPEQATNPDDYLTRADFMAIINRAYGYTQGNEIFFEDVTADDWFYDDVSIATTAGYIQGTSPTTVEPNGTLSRETTAFILGKNMMLSDAYGENMYFTDTREISSWSRALVNSASRYGLMVGYNDGSFRPVTSITRGEIGALVLQAVGTPIQESGEISLTEVFGNVTITEPGTILKDTVIAGDLYISNGIGLGSVILENVTVLGRIVVSGGESQDGDASIILRNVTAHEMIVDNMEQQKVTIRVEGNSYIENTYVRTDAYIEDICATDIGLRSITLESDPGTVLDVAGRIKEVNNISPNTTIRVTAGTVDVLNIDEQATESTTEVLRGAEVINLNIDVATNVTGDGDVQNLTVNADDVVVSMLPDNIEIRPGVSANIFGEDMDNLTAEEFSIDPLILSGYPKASDVAPSTLDAVFATNKTGTIYWAISNMTQGSVGEDDLIKPPSYGGISLQSGTVDITAANDEFIAAVSGLEVGGFYYLSAILEDARGDRSPVKVTAFSTPDDSIPAFAEGYPKMTQIESFSATFTAMTTKTCKMYYVVFPRDAAEPTPDEFLANSLEGSVRNGIVDMTKNQTDSIYLSNLEELTEYDLYLWLTDADGMNSAEEVTLLQFKTTDGTNPIFNQAPEVVQVGYTDANFSFNLNEDGTVYWVAVPEGSQYPKPNPADASQTTTAPLDDEYAKQQVYWGQGIGTEYYTGNTPALANQTMTFSLTGLSLESAYDLYYVARDLAGNFSDAVGVLTFNTIDNTPPEYLRQEFTAVASAGDEDAGISAQPFAHTNVKLIFSEGIQSQYFNGSTNQSFLELYNNVVALEGIGGDALTLARDTLAAALENSFDLQIKNGSAYTSAVVRNSSNHDVLTEADNWVIDYRFATVALVNKELIITFPTNREDGQTSGLNLSSGVTYRFMISNIQDSSSDANNMVPDIVPADEFTTVYAQINLTPGNAEVAKPYVRNDTGVATDSQITVDTSMIMTPSDMSSVSNNIVYDIRFTPNYFVAFNLYVRVLNEYGIYTGAQNEYLPGIMDNTEAFVDGDGSRRTKLENHWEPDKNGWIKLNISDAAPTAGASSIIQGYDTYTRGVGYSNSFLGYYDTPFIQMNYLSEGYQYEFAFEITNFRSSSVRNTWNGTLSMHTQIYAGSRDYIRDLSEATNPSPALINSVSLVSMPSDYYVEKTFSDSTPPEFTSGAPVADVEDITTSVDVALKTGSKGTVYYVMVPQVNPSDLAPTLSYIPDGRDDNKVLWEDVCNIEREYLKTIGGEPWHPSLDTPTAGELVEYLSATTDSDWTGSLDFINNTTVQTIDFEDLDPLTNYYIYFMIEGENSPLSEVYVYKFTTLATERPIYSQMTFDSDANVFFQSHVDANVAYQIINVSQLTNAQFALIKEDSYFGEQIAANGGGTSRTDVLNEDITFDDYFAKSNYADIENFTVLDALKTPYTTSSAGTHEGLGTPTNWLEGHTVFDVYAPASLKSLVYNMIYTPNNQSNSATQSMDMLENVKAEAERGGTATLNDEFIFLVAGHNQNADTTDTVANIKSFAALTGIIITDNTRPIINTVSTSAFSNVLEEDGKFSGFITLSFDKPLYVWYNNSLRFLSTGPGHQSTNTNIPTYDAYTYVGLQADLATNTPVASRRLQMIEDDALGNDVATQVLQFRFEDVVAGEQFLLFNGAALSSSGGQSGEIMTVLFEQVSKDTEIILGAAQEEVAGNGDKTITTPRDSVTTYVMQWTVNWNDGQITSYGTWTYTKTLEPLVEVEVYVPPVVDSGTSSVTPSNMVTSVSLPASYSMKMGESWDLTATVSGTGTYDSTCTWSITGGKSGYPLTTDSSEKMINILSSYPGSYTITATAGGIKSNECKLEISEPTITVTETTKQSSKTGYGVLKVTVEGVGSLANSGQKTIAWSAGNGVKLSTGTSFSSTSASSNLTDNNGTWSATVNYQTSQDDAVAVSASFLQVWGLSKSFSVTSTLFDTSDTNMFNN